MGAIAERAYIILHERHHIRRLDHITKVLAFAALCIHWFNPLVWLAFILSGKDMEMSCDEAVVRKMGDAVLADYAASLLNLATGRHTIAGMPLAFGEGDTKGRIRNLAKWKRPRQIGFVAACSLVIFSAVLLAFNPSGIQLSKLVIDEVNMNAVLEDMQTMSVQYEDDFLSCDKAACNRFVATMDKIKIRKKALSESRSESRSRSFSIIINDTVHLYFNEYFSEIWFDNGVKPSFSYAIMNPEVARELLMDFRFSLRSSEGEVREWFDDYQSGEMDWSGRREISLEAFPGVTFRWTPEQVQAVLEDGQIIPLYSGMPVWNVFFADLTGDGLPELCSTLSFGSGIVDERIIIYDYANGASYSLEDRMEYDYSLSMQDGGLIVTRRAFGTEHNAEAVEMGYLSYMDGAVQLIPLEDEPAQLRSGTTYVPYECLYLSPLSSYAAIGGDSGCIYRVGEDYFETVTRSGGVQDLIEVSKWQWQVFPYTDEEWAALHLPAMSWNVKITEVYDELLYQPLTAGKFLLQADGDLLLVELATNPQTGPYLQSIYSLVPESTMGVAYWEYRPSFSSRMPAFRFVFDMPHTEISAVCTASPLVNFDGSEQALAGALTINGENVFWSPMDQNGYLADSAAICFTVHNGAQMLCAGTLYITSSGGAEDGQRIYRASMVGTGLHLSPDTVHGGGIVSLPGGTVDAGADA